MSIELAPLPYPMGSLAPHISERTLSFHYGRHHAGYVKNLNTMIAGTEHEGSTVEQIVAAAPVGSALFNNAAQSWNHAFYWNSMRPGSGDSPSAALAGALETSFGSVDGFLEQFKAAALGNFASGWTWLATDPGDPNRLVVVNTDDADTPLRNGQTALLTIDVWEHAYYLDHQNARAAYVDAFCEHLLNWEFASANHQAITA